MPRGTKPHSGSLGFYPRKRAKRETPRFRTWPKVNETVPLGFFGYKAGMTHIIGTDGRKKTPTSGQEIFIPATIIETPPLFIAGIRYYGEGEFGKRTLTEKWAENLPKHLGRTINLPKKKVEREIPEEEVVDVTLIVCTEPWKTNIGRKKPHIGEIAIGGGLEEKIKFAEDSLGKEIHVWEVFKEGEQVDVKAEAKGKGFQGPVKRFGIFEFGHKKEKIKRGVCSIGPWYPPRVMWTVPRAGQMGYHTRTEYNKVIIRVGKAGEEITPKGGFLNYGVVQSDFLILAGSVPGPAKRIIGIRKAIRPSKSPLVVSEVKYISLESKQGV